MLAKCGSGRQWRIWVEWVEGVVMGYRRCRPQMLTVEVSGSLVNCVGNLSLERSRGVKEHRVVVRVILRMWGNSLEELATMDI